MGARRNKELTAEQEAALAVLPGRRADFLLELHSNGGNAMQAAIATGYSERSARQIASAMLTDVDVARAHDLLKKGKRDRRIMRMREAQRLLTSMARGELKDTAVYEGMAIEVPATLTVRQNAIDKLVKVQGGYAPTKVDATITAVPKNVAEGRAKIEAIVARLGGRVTWDEDVAALESGAEEGGDHD